LLAVRAEAQVAGASFVSGVQFFAGDRIDSTASTPPHRLHRIDFIANG
jgi:hypothetical protein